MLECLFKKSTGYACSFMKRISTQVFSCEVCKMFKKSFSYRIPPVAAFASPVAASIFFK